MNKRESTTTAGTQPIPGYTLRKRLGAGGYGEVWLADAPGGLQKAIKLIYGNVDDARALNELRSLERIRSAHHPFILSLERIEIVQGKVIIVTELAEGSLQDRYEARRRQGSPGIPRIELLDFLRDSADALDFLAQKHSLQHLDVKPGNLLIIADHIKVADFGLVKDLHDSNQSLVSGLTPTYSAPEVFDGRPDFRSDQYSLAIVYMEMLTGRLPFNGRSPGELARQHLTQAPNLDPLPPADRSIVQRALSKNPLDRYATSRQFVDQLLKVRSAVVPILDSSDRANSVAEAPSATYSATDTRNWSTSRKQQFATSIPPQQFSSNWILPRAMFIGVGGQGVLALRELRSDLLQNVDNRLTNDDYSWLALDTSRGELETVIHGDKLLRLPIENAVLLPIHSPQAYKKFDNELFTPLSRRWLYNIPKSLSTEGVRPIATLALITNYPALMKLIESRLTKLVQQHEADKDCQQPLRIYVTGSLHGGTGSALLAETAFIVRRIFARTGFNNYRICAVASVAATTNRLTTANLRTANAIAAISELAYFMQPSCEKPSLDYRAGQITSCDCPFDWVTLVDGGMLDDRKSVSQNPQRLARCISLDCQTLASAALVPSRQSWRQSEHGWLRSVRCESVQQIGVSTPDALAKQCCSNVVNTFLSYLTSNGDVVREPESLTADGCGTLSSSFLPITPEAIKKLLQQTINDLLLVSDNSQTEEFEKTWQSRLSMATDVRQQQIAADMARWQRWLIHHSRVRVYVWRQIERIQLELIQGLINYHDTLLPDVVDQLRKSPTFSALKINLSEAAQSYVGDLVKTCLKSMEAIRAEGKQFTSQLQTWRQSLVSQNDLRCNVALDTTRLPPQMQHLFNHVCKQLEDNLATMLTTKFESIPEKLGLVSVGLAAISADATSVTPQSDVELLSFAQRLLLQSCVEMGLNPDDLECQLYHFSTVSFDELKDVAPPLADGSSEIIRMLVANREQLSTVDKYLNELGISETTTLIPGTASLGTQVICDAADINISYIISTLWRPTGATLSLVERVRTRVDIDWEDASALLSCRNTNLLTAARSDSETGAETSPPNTGVLPMTGHVATGPIIVT